MMNTDVKAGELTRCQTCGEIYVFRHSPECTVCVYIGPDTEDFIARMLLAHHGKELAQ
jgi:hypothetical protein